MSKISKRPVVPVTATPSLDLATQIERHRVALTVEELAEILSIPGKQIYSLIKFGSLPSYRIASSLRLDPVTTAAWLRSRRA
jgi:excisionase family DNA binding protein